MNEGLHLMLVELGNMLGGLVYLPASPSRSFVPAVADVGLRYQKTLSWMYGNVATVDVILIIKVCVDPRHTQDRLRSPRRLGCDVTCS